MAARKKNTGWVWHMVDSLEGDKVIWMIVLLLVMISVLAISSSTSLLAIQSGSSRGAIIQEQLLIAAIGLAIIILLYKVKAIGLFRIFARFGYILSMVGLLMLATHANLGFIKAQTINNATRTISVFGVQLHVFEFVKVLMIMYLAWAVDAYKKDSFKTVNALSRKLLYSFLAKPKWKLFIYIYFPIISVSVFILNGSVSSTLFIGGMMFATIMMGGIKLKSVVPYALVAVVGFCLCMGIYSVSGGEKFSRFGTAVGRVTRASEDPEQKLLSLKRGSKEFQDALDEVKQPISAKIALSEGGILGKGPGRSTQRYVVPIMFEDYMFCFIVEEYGLLGAFIVLCLYCSLVARGAIIVRNCDGAFAKTAVAGLVLLISGQAFMHMMINVDLGPLTGQTLPMISHGNSSFLAFSIAFGVILSVSRMAKKRIDREAEKAVPIVAQESDDLRESLGELEQLDNQ